MQDRRIAFLATSLLALVALVLSSCGRGPQPVVRSAESFEAVRLGNVQYITPAGVRVVEKGSGYVIHTIDDLPDTMVKVYVETDPPRNLRFDADAEKRRFLREVPNSHVSSAQYHERDGRRSVRVVVLGQDEEGASLVGIIKMVRKGEDTAIVKMVGPIDRQEDILRMTELIGSRIEI